MIKSVYGKEAIAQLDEDDTEEGGLIEIEPVHLIELDELILGALNQKSYEFAQKGTSFKKKGKVEE